MTEYDFETLTSDHVEALSETLTEVLKREKAESERKR